MYAIELDGRHVRCRITYQSRTNGAIKSMVAYGIEHRTEGSVKIRTTANSSYNAKYSYLALDHEIVVEPK